MPACGSGETTSYLVAQGAHVTGLDISPKMVDKFRATFPNAIGVCASIFSTGFADGAFDCASIVGGLHHFHPRLQEAVDEVHRILKPGGFFCFFEPVAGTFPDVVRRVWYQHDRRHFEEDEAAIDTTALLKRNAEKFRGVSQRFGGNIAYLLVLNSMVFRMPLALKRLYAPIAIFIERLITPFQPRIFSCFVICRWQKNGR